MSAPASIIAKVREKLCGANSQFFWRLRADGELRPCPQRSDGPSSSDRPSPQSRRAVARRRTISYLFNSPFSISSFMHQLRHVVRLAPVASDMSVQDKPWRRSL